MNQQQIMEYFQRRFDEAVSLKRKGAYAKSISIYEELIDIAPNVPQVHEGMAKVLAVNGNYARAAQYFKLAIIYYTEISDWDKVLLCREGYLLMTDGNSNDADFKTIVKGWSGA